MIKGAKNRRKRGKKVGEKIIMGSGGGGGGGGKESNWRSSDWKE